MRVIHTKKTYSSKWILLTSLTLGLFAVGTHAETLGDNEAFNAAVEAVKARNYSRALILFEDQANDAKHDAQYNMAVLLQAGKGRPSNYPDALYWAWLAQLGGIEEAEDLAGNVLDALTEDDIKSVRTRVGENLQARLENGDINAIAQFAEYHQTILAEPNHNTAYIWYSIAVALNIPDMVDRRDDTESDVETKDLARLQTEARELFERYNFAPFTQKKLGGTNEG